MVFEHTTNACYTLSDNMLSFRRNQKGFTIVELLIVIVVISVLAAISAVAFRGFSERALQSILQQDLSQVQKELAYLKIENGTYPEDLDDITRSDKTNLQYTVTGSQYCVTALSPGANKPYFITDSTGVQEGVCPDHSPFAETTGGNKSEITIAGETYALHVFSSSDSFNVARDITASYLVVAGGGGGGISTNSIRGAGGGGAGGVLEGTASFSRGESIQIIVGSGGQPAENGHDSSIGNLVTAFGGGAGGKADNGNSHIGTGGGSGGGGGGQASPGGSGVAGQGYDGGQAASSGLMRAGGGGGGAGMAGSSAEPSRGGSGGVGRISSITGSDIYYGGGGGGGSSVSSLGGAGGGGNGGGSTGSTPGVDGSGGGGGGAYGTGFGSAGGSGIVIIRYRI